MKDFRIEKCFEDGVVSEYAIFSDGSRKKRIHVRPVYGRYFEVDNELNTSAKNFTKYYFRGRIKDAVDMILTGNGDCICVYPSIYSNYPEFYYPEFYNNYCYWDTTIKLVYFIDRSIGEKIRQKFINDWKDAKFYYCISYGSKNSLFGCRPLMPNFQQMQVNSKDKPLTFDSEKAASDYAIQLIEKSKNYARKIANHNGDDDTLIDVESEVLDEIQKEFGCCGGIVLDFTNDMLDENYKPKTPDFSLDVYEYRIEQFAITEPQDNIEGNKTATTNNNVISDVTDLDEVVDHIINCLELDDKRFSFVIAAGRTISIFDKDKRKSYNISVQPVE